MQEVPAIMTQTPAVEHEAFRADLLAHCYRMLGSYEEAEDLVQETLLRAWKAADRYDADRSSLRTWLHAIATNACLTHLRGRPRRPLPTGLGAAGDDPHAALTPSLDVPWLQPFPDRRLGDPEAVAVDGATLRLALVASWQLLTARQRAALLLREVVGLSAAETAQALSTSAASVNSSLQRARATLREAGTDIDLLREPSDPEERATIDRYASAFEAADVPGLIRLLADDVILEMPPVNLWLRGKEHYATFMRRVFDARGEGWLVVPVRANGTDAIASYAPDPASATGAVRAHSVQLFVVEGGAVRRTVVFVDPSYFAWFDLPLHRRRTS